MFKLMKTYIVTILFFLIPFLFFMIESLSVSRTLSVAADVLFELVRLCFIQQVELPIWLLCVV